MVDDLEATLPAQVLVNLLLRLDRCDEAVDIAAQYLLQVPDSMLVSSANRRALPAIRPSGSACRRGEQDEPAGAFPGGEDSIGTEILTVERVSFADLQWRFYKKRASTRPRTL